MKHHSPSYAFCPSNFGNDTSPFDICPQKERHLISKRQFIPRVLCPDLPQMLLDISLKSLENMSLMIPRK
jgi:hypothetical protein